ncbi:hypothetical protein VVD49_00995 [Uliginosibacterium sp. H3]|uniref:Lipoprotein n=1 Tax=Uliginosibacterium silvisoli TaxID=3114758 RepID=A0ABU6JY16_9RHOO|nr:hypothetical protein [Uliginosibacterium sp. H3]
MKYLVLLCLGVLAGCAARPSVTVPATLPNYIAPTEGAVASLQIRSNQVAGVGVFSSFEDQRACKGIRMIANTKTTQNQLKASTTLRADEPASLWFAYVGPGNRLCNVAMTFKPVKGRNYLALANATDVACAIALQDISDPSNPKQEPTRFARTVVLTGRESAHCAAVDVDAELTKVRRPNLSGLRMDDLKALLPAAPPAEAAK